MIAACAMEPITAICKAGAMVPSSWQTPSLPGMRHAHARAHTRAAYIANRQRLYESYEHSAGIGMTAGALACPPAPGRVGARRRGHGAVMAPLWL